MDLVVVGVDEEGVGGVEVGMEVDVEAEEDAAEVVEVVEVVVLVVEVIWDLEATSTRTL